MSPSLPSSYFSPPNSSDTSSIFEYHTGSWYRSVVFLSGFLASNAPWIGLCVGNIPLVATVDYGKRAWEALQACPTPFFSLFQHLREE
jgi:hypothetical protein